MNYGVNNIYPKPAIDNTNTPVASQRLTVDGTAGGLKFATAFNVNTTMVVLDVQDADVMCTFDNSAPTSTWGHRLYAGTPYTWSKAAAQAAKFIRQGTNSATIQASEFNV